MLSWSVDCLIPLCSSHLMARPAQFPGHRGGNSISNYSEQVFDLPQLSAPWIYQWHTPSPCSMWFDRHSWGDQQKRLSHNCQKVGWRAETNDEQINLPPLSYCIIAVTRLNCLQVGFQVLRNRNLHLLFGQSIALRHLKILWSGPNRNSISKYLAAN